MTMTEDLARRAAWFHAPHRKSTLLKRCHDDREAWLVYVAWHKRTTGPNDMTPDQCREDIARTAEREN
jgi:hypothetical protein